MAKELNNLVEFKNGQILWEGSFKARIVNAKINFDFRRITIDTKESDDLPGYSILLDSNNNFEFNGEFQSVESEYFENENGILVMKYFKSNDEHILAGFWIQENEKQLCIIELKR